MDEKFKKQFPTRKELEIVSSTREWKIGLHFLKNHAGKNISNRGKKESIPLESIVFEFK